jgi:photosystem II stability/assembly factor-like uncharacterized protein
MSSQVTAIAIDDDGTLFAGTYREGVFRSRDNGKKWDFLGQGGTDVRDLVFDIEGRLFVATFGKGVYRTSDQGDSWQETNIGLFDPRVQSLATDTSGTVLAGTFGSGVFALDGGIAWRPASSGLRDFDVRGVAINSQGLSFAACRGDGVFVSDDYGYSWTRMPGTLRLGVLRSITTSGRGVFVAAWGGGVARTYPGEQDWDQLDAGLPTSKVWWASMTPDGRLLAGTHTHGIYEWVQGRWQLLGLDGDIVTKIVSGRAGEIWVGTRTGIYRATGDATTFELLGVPRSYVFSLAETEMGTVVAATYESGLMRLQRGDTVWRASDIHFETTYSVIAVGNALYSGGEFGNLCQSSDDGKTWRQVNNDDEDDRTRATIWTLHSDGERIYAGSIGDGIFRSLDNGSTWKRAGLENQNVLTLSTDESRTIYAGTNTGFYRSRDGGDTWEDITTAKMSAGVHSSLFDPLSGLLAGTADGIVRSLDGGTTWVEEGLDGMLVTEILITESGGIYAGTREDGIFSRSHRDAPWAADNEGLSNPAVLTMIAVKRSIGTEEIFAGTFGDGVFYTVVSTAVERSDPKASRLISVTSYPNPFSATTTLSFYLSRLTAVTLSVYDVQGKRVAVVVEERLPAGDHTVTWKPGHLASGAYYIRLETDSGARTGSVFMVR